MIPADTITLVAETLNMSTDRATEWVESKLDGHPVRNVAKYIRTCVENYVPPKPKASNGSTGATKPETGYVRKCERCGERPIPWRVNEGFTDDFPYANVGGLPVPLVDLWDYETGGYYHPDGKCPPTPGRCETHWQEQPCRGCAADRKARPEPDEYIPAAVRVLENIAAILGVESTPMDVDDDVGDRQVEVTRAGLCFGAYTNLPTQHITIYSGREDGNHSSLPDEQFRDRAIKIGAETRDYRPHDAVDIAEHWHKQTRDQEATA